MQNIKGRQSEPRDEDKKVITPEFQADHKVDPSPRNERARASR